MVDLDRRPASPRTEASTAPDRFARGNARWLLTLTLWLALVASLASLHPLFEGLSWWFASAGVSALVFAATGVARALHLPSFVAFLVGAVVAGLACTAVASGGTAVLGVVPTAATLDQVRLLAAQAQDVIVSDQAPIPVSDAMLAVVVFAVACAALLIDLIARVVRLPGLTGVVFAIVVAVPSFVPDVATSWFWVVVTVVAYVALLVVSTGRRPSRSALVTGVSALAIGGLVTGIVPIALSSPVSNLGSGTGLSTGVNPVINLGNNLRRGTPVTVLTYRTTQTQGTYLKLVDLVDFSGTSWSPASVKLNSANNVTKLPAAPGIDPSTSRNTVTTNVAIDLLRSPYLPLPVPPTKVTGIDSRWKYVDESGLTIRSTTEGSQGLDYKVVSKPVDPTRDQIISSLASPPAALSVYRDVKGVPDSITKLAKQVTRGAANPFDAAVDLQSYFRDGQFTYSEDTPVKQGYDGSGLDMVETFLKTKSGYCVHFASAMAVMARTLGIPSRIAVGFLPGTQVTPGSTSTWTVTSNDLHTWPELYFQGLGWVPFEPTVGQGTTSGYLQQTGADATTPPVPTTEPSALPTTAPQATQNPGAAATATPTGSTSSASAAAPSGQRVEGPLLGLAALVLVLLLATPWWMRAARRRRRLAQGPPDAALSAWLEVIDTARDLGYPVDPAATPQRAAAVLSALIGGEGAASLDSLRAAVEAERFGGDPAGEEVTLAARGVLQGLRSHASALARAHAALAPRSLFGPQRARSAETA